MRFFIFILNRYIFRKNLVGARMPVENITYGDKYQDEKYEYRSPAPAVGQQHDMSYRTHLGNQSMI